MTTSFNDGMQPFALVKILVIIFLAFMHVIDVNLEVVQPTLDSS